MHATFERLVAEAAGAKEIADVAGLKWRELDAVLSPIIGQRGVAALYKRALYLIRADYPWLVAAHAGDAPFGDFAPLQAALLQQETAQACRANLALYDSFDNILISLIGVSLTERLLHSISNPPDGSAVQDLL